MQLPSLNPLHPPPPLLNSPATAMDINSDRNDGLPIFPHKKHYDMNGKIMVGAIISLSLVILIVLILHIYARCAVRSQARRRRRAATIHHLSLHPTHHAQLAAAQPKTGLDPAVIASLPHFIIKDHLHDGDPTGGECAVCLSFLEAEEAARILPNCKHTFHVECIDRWLTNQSTCPICRTQVAPWPCSAPPSDGAVLAEGDRISDSSSKEGGSSSRLSSFRRMIGRDWSSSRRIHIQPLEQEEAVEDLESQ